MNVLTGLDQDAGLLIVALQLLASPLDSASPWAHMRNGKDSKALEVGSLGSGGGQAVMVMPKRALDEEEGDRERTGYEGALEGGKREALEEEVVSWPSGRLVLLTPWWEDEQEVVVANEAVSGT